MELPGRPDLYDRLTNDEVPDAAFPRIKEDIEHFERTFYLHHRHLLPQCGSRKPDELERLTEIVMADCQHDQILQFAGNSFMAYGEDQKTVPFAQKTRVLPRWADQLADVCAALDDE